jgi:putative transposase
MNFPYPIYWPQFYTATIQNWKHLLKDDSYKDVIIESLQYLTNKNIISLNAFVIMSNHIHLIWQAQFGYTPSAIQSSLMKFTAGKFRKKLMSEFPEQIEEYRINKYDRQYQFWKREPLGIELFTPDVFWQKLNYIHENPVRAGIVEFPYEYRYSSASFYEFKKNEFGILTQHNNNKCGKS